MQNCAVRPCLELKTYLNFCPGGKSLVRFVIGIGEKMRERERESVCVSVCEYEFVC